MMENKIKELKESEIRSAAISRTIAIGIILIFIWFTVSNLDAINKGDTCKQLKIFADSCADRKQYLICGSVHDLTIIPNYTIGIINSSSPYKSISISDVNGK